MPGLLPIVRVPSPPWSAQPQTVPATLLPAYHILTSSPLLKVMAPKRKQQRLLVHYWSVQSLIRP